MTDAVSIGAGPVRTAYGGGTAVQYNTAVVLYLVHVIDEQNDMKYEDYSNNTLHR